MAKQPSANPTYKLTYFNVQALAEPIRMLLSYGNIQFEDVRIEKDAWPALKPKTPMGQLPVLEIDGIQVYQSVAMARYVAKLVGLAGKNDWENLLIDITVDNINDLRLKVAAVHHETDEKAKQKKFDDLKKETLPFYLDKFDAAAKENNGHLALGRLTWADVYLLAISNLFNFILGFDFTQNHPNLKRVLTNASNVPSIKAWIDKRPKTTL
jgi:glutathione S-transferase